ncbi:MAG: PhoU domain-containing protein, partial [Bacteroidota bacterium]
IDEQWHALWQRLNEQMKTHPEIIPQATYLLLVARYLERIGDHTVNVMERLNYIETGKSGHLV